MAFNLSTRPGNLGAKVVEDPAADASGNNDNVLGASGTVFSVFINNTANSGNPVYLRLYNHATPTIGGGSPTAPNMLLICPAGVSRQYNFGYGVAFGVALSYACTTTGADNANTAPSNAVPIVIIAS